MTQAMRRALLSVVLCTAWLAHLPASAGVFEARSFSTTEAEQRYQKLTAELRCLVCQNQNLADSNADLAADLRRQVFEMIEAGRTNQEIIDYMVQRYGDFVLYNPPLAAKTWLLWLGPFAAFGCGLWALIRRLRRQSVAAAPPTALSQADSHRLDDLLHAENSRQE